MPTTEEDFDALRKALINNKSIDDVKKNLQNFDVTATDKDGHNCLMLACKYSTSPEVMKLVFGKIVEMGGPDLFKSQLNQNNNNSWNCLKICCWHSKSREVSNLLALVLFHFELFKIQYEELDKFDKEQLKVNHGIDSSSWAPDVAILAEVREILQGAQEEKAVKTLQQFSQDGTKQFYVAVEEEYKLETLMDLSGTFVPLRKCVVFVDTPSAVDSVSAQLSNKCRDVYTIHQDMSNDDRGKALQHFIGGASGVLVTSDLVQSVVNADRFIIINFHLPTNVENYVHSIGRADGAVRKGVVINFVSQRDVQMLREIEQHYNTVIGELPLNFETHLALDEASSPPPQQKQLASQKKKAEEEAALAAQKKTEEEAALDAQKKTEEEAALAAQKKAEEEAALAAQKKTEEEAALTKKKKAEEEAALAEKTNDRPSDGSETNDGLPPSFCFKRGVPDKNFEDSINALLSIKEAPPNRPDLDDLIPDKHDAESLLHYLDTSLSELKSRPAIKKFIDENGLTDDDIKVIHSYKIQNPYPVYRWLNGWLCGDRRDDFVKQNVAPFFTLLYRAMEKLPRVTTNVNRGIKVNGIASLKHTFDNYETVCKKGNVLSFWGFSSFSTKSDVVNRPEFVGTPDEEGIVYSCGELVGVSIEAFAPKGLKDESELLPLCPCVLKVVNNFKMGKKLIIGVEQMDHSNFAYVLPKQ